MSNGGKPIERARIHEFNGQVALRIGDSETVYMSTQMAHQLARSLEHARYQIMHAYHYPTTEVTS